MPLKSTKKTFTGLQINVIMREGWEEKWQLVNDKKKSAVEAAAILGVGVFASGSLMEVRIVCQFQHDTCTLYSTEGNNHQLSNVGCVGRFVEKYGSH